MLAAGGIGIEIGLWNVDSGEEILGCNHLEVGFRACLLARWAYYCLKVHE